MKKHEREIDNAASAEYSTKLIKIPGQPAEVAPAYVFLASDDSSYISGQVIHINGGEPVNG